MIPEHPFAPQPERASFVETPHLLEALGRLGDALGMREPFLLVTGEPGAGKTALVAEAIARWEARAAAVTIAHPTLVGAELLEEIARRLGDDPRTDATRPTLLASIERAVAANAERDRVTVIVVDDAHDLSTEALEELRLVVSAAQQARRPLEVMLAGSSALETRLAEPALAAIAQRVSVRVRVVPLSPGEVQRYIQHRVTAAGGDGPGLFPRRACREIAALSGGVPRRINALATEAMRPVRAGLQPVVTAEMARTAAIALWGSAGAPEHAAAVAEVDDAEAAAPVAGPAPAASDAPALQATPASSAPKPVAPPASPAPIPAAPLGRVVVRCDSSRTPESEPPRPAPPARQDPQEWVQRFIGDRGPLQLSSRAASESTWRHEPVDAAPARSATPAPDTSANAPDRTDRAPGSRRKRRPAIPGPLLAGSLAAIAIVAVIAGLVHVARLPHRGAAQVAGAPGIAPSLETQRSSGGVRAAVKDPAARVRTVKPVPPRPSESPSASADEEGNAASTTERDASAAAPGSEANPARRYTLDVGGYLESGRALEVRDQLRRSIGLPAWVVRGGEAGGETHRILVGVYRTAERATAASELLLAEGKVAEARVVPLPSRRARK